MKVATCLVQTWIYYQNNWLDTIWLINSIPLYKKLTIIWNEVYVLVNNIFRYIKFLVNKYRLILTILSRHSLLDTVV